MNKKVKTGVLLLGFALMVLLIWKRFDSVAYGGDFSLQSAEGDWTYSGSPKKLNLIYFGFTKCGDVCPVSMGKMASAFEQLTPEERAHVRLIFVSVDAEHDTPEDASRFAKTFDDEFIGVTGHKAEIDSAISKFPAGYVIEQKKESHLGYIIIHPDKFFFVDEEGKMIDEISAQKEPDKMADAIRTYL